MVLLETWEDGNRTIAVSEWTCMGCSYGVFCSNAPPIGTPLAIRLGNDYRFPYLLVDIVTNDDVRPLKVGCLSKERVGTNVPGELGVHWLLDERPADFTIESTLLTIRMMLSTVI